MKKLFKVISISFLIFAAAVSASGEQKSVIAVGTIESHNNPVFQSLSSTVSSTLTLNLKLLGGFQCTGMQDITLSAIKSAGSGFLNPGIDNAIAGNLKENKKNIELTLAVYSSNEEKIIIEDSISIENYLDIFDAVDTLSIRMIEALTKSRLAIGSLIIDNMGIDYPYQLIIDDTVAGENTGKIQNIRAGKRNVKLEEIRSGRVITEKTVNIAEGTTLALRFSVPSLDADEAKSLADFDRKIGVNWGSPLSAAAVSSAVGGALGYIRERSNRVLDLLDNKYTELEKVFNQSGYNFNFVPAALISIDGELSDWDNVPVFIDDAVNKPLAANIKNPTDPALKPGSDIGIGKVAVSRDGKTLFFLISSGNGNISSGVEYTFGLAKDSNKYLQFKIYGGSSKIRYWYRSDGHDEEVKTENAFKIKENYIEASIDISRTDFYYDMLDNKCRIHLKTQKPEPFATYNIAGDKPLRLTPLLRYNSDDKWIPSELDVPDTAGFYTASMGSEYFDNIYFLTDSKIKVDGKMEDWIPTEPVTGSKEWVESSREIATDLLSLHLAGNSDFLYAGAFLDREDVQFQPENRVTELVIKGDNTPDGGYYSLEIRLRSQPSLYVRKVTYDNKKSVITSGKEIKGLDFKYSNEFGLLEISAPMNMFRQYMTQKSYYEVTFGIREEKSTEYKITKPVNVCF